MRRVRRPSDAACCVDLKRGHDVVTLCRADHDGRGPPCWVKIPGRRPSGQDFCLPLANVRIGTSSGILPILSPLSSIYRAFRCLLVYIENLIQLNPKERPIASHPSGKRPSSSFGGACPPPPRQQVRQALSQRDRRRKAGRGPQPAAIADAKGDIRRPRVRRDIRQRDGHGGQPDQFADHIHHAAPAAAADIVYLTGVAGGREQGQRPDDVPHVEEIARRRQAADLQLAAPWPASQAAICAATWPHTMLAGSPGPTMLNTRPMMTGARPRRA